MFDKNDAMYRTLDGEPPDVLEDFIRSGVVTRSRKGSIESIELTKTARAALAKRTIKDTVLSDRLDVGF